MMDGFEPVSGESLWLKNVAELEVKGLHIEGEEIRDPTLYGEMKTALSDVSINGRTLG